MDCTVDLANCDVIFHSSHVKIRCSLSDFGIDMESKACLGFGCGTLRILQLTITESFTVLGLVGSRGFQHFVLYSRQIIRDHDWVNSHTHTHDMHAAGCCNICKRSLLLSWNLFNLAVETKIRPYPASLPAGEETVPKLQETSPVHGFQQCHFFTILSDIVWNVSKTTQGTCFRKLRAGWSGFGRRSGSLSHLDLVSTCAFEVFLFIAFIANEAKAPKQQLHIWKLHTAIYHHCTYTQYMLQ